MAETNEMMRRMRSLASAGPKPVAAKVPEITLVFWILKVLTTGMGESMSDFLAHVSFVLAAGVGLSVLALGLGLQLWAREYRAPRYWFAVLAVAVFGTMAADGFHIVLRVPYALTTTFYGIVLGLVFVVWYRREGTLSIHSITTRSRELYYWIAVLATFALGTAAGDFTASTLRLGYDGSAVLFGIVIAVPAVAWWRLRLDPIVAFWAAYVVTRPLGASLVDWLGKPDNPLSRRRGLGLGDGTVSLAALAVFVALVAYVAITRQDIQRRAVDEPHSSRPRPQAEPSVEGASS
jgi:uncharacterized membrane-anchored protein